MVLFRPVAKVCCISTDLSPRGLESPKRFFWRSLIPGPGSSLFVPTNFGLKRLGEPILPLRHHCLNDRPSGVELSCCNVGCLAWGRNQTNDFCKVILDSNDPLHRNAMPVRLGVSLHVNHNLLEPVSAQQRLDWMTASLELLLHWLLLSADWTHCKELHDLIVCNFAESSADFIVGLFPFLVPQSVTMHIINWIKHILFFHHCLPSFFEKQVGGTIRLSAWDYFIIFHVVKDRAMLLF